MEKVKVSVCVTIFNEKDETIKNLILALKRQIFKADEIIIIDAKDYNNCSRSEGRNIAIKKAKNNIIAITDAGCIPHKDWLASLCSKFEIGEARKNIVVAGGYEMIAKNNFQKACRVFLGIQKEEMNDLFMPSARSMAFTKSAWRKAGGFPEKLRDTAEDTMFNLKLIKSGAKFIVAKDAVVDWYMPNSVYEFAKKIFNYAKGDAESKIWWHPVKKMQTHNIKVMSIFLRYLLAIMLYRNLEEITGIYILLGIYMLWAFNKAGFWGIVLQFVSDFAGIIGFTYGILQTSLKRD